MRLMDALKLSKETGLHAAVFLLGSPVSNKFSGCVELTGMQRAYLVHALQELYMNGGWSPEGVDRFEFHGQVMRSLLDPLKLVMSDAAVTVEQLTPATKLEGKSTTAREYSQAVGETPPVAATAAKHESSQAVGETPPVAAAAAKHESSQAVGETRPVTSTAAKHESSQAVGETCPVTTSAAKHEIEAKIAQARRDHRTAVSETIGCALAVLLRLDFVWYDDDIREAITRARQLLSVTQSDIKGRLDP